MISFHKARVVARMAMDVCERGRGRPRVYVCGGLAFTRLGLQRLRVEGLQNCNAEPKELSLVIPPGPVSIFPRFALALTMSRFFGLMFVCYG